MSIEAVLQPRFHHAMSWNILELPTITAWLRQNSVTFSTKNDQFASIKILQDPQISLKFAKCCQKKLHIWVWKRCKACQSCRPWKMLQNEPFVPKLGFDVAENGPSKAWATNQLWTHPWDQKSIYAFASKCCAADRKSLVSLRLGYPSIKQDAMLSWCRLVSSAFESANCC